MSIQAKLNALQRQNQELKMELTELRNAFDLNRDVLNILSGKSEPSIKHFYIMLKKLNEHIIDLADNQFKARKERYKKVEEFSDLELKYEAAQQEVVELRRKIESFRQEKPVSRSSEGDNHVQSSLQQVITPKESYIILTEEIRKISNELFVMGNTCAKLRIENGQLKHILKSGESRLDSTLRTRLPQSVMEISEESDSEPDQYDPEEGNRTINYTSYNTTRNRNKKQKRNSVQNKENPTAKRVKYLEIELDNKQREIGQLQREKSHCQERLALLVSTQRRLNLHSRRLNREEQKKRGQALIDMVQWRFSMEVLDEPTAIRNLEWNPEVRCLSR